MEELKEYSVKFKDIQEYVGIYMIASDGRVFNKKSGKFLKPSLNSHGYLFVNLRKDGKCRSHRIHRLIAEAFIGNPENKTDIDHINTVKTDNRIENLRHVTKSENMMNRKIFKNNKLQIKGIRETEYGYRADIRKDNKNYSKCFVGLEECIAWRKAKELELFGEYNFKG